jgi:hypothetical protein
MFETSFINKAKGVKMSSIATARTSVPSVSFKLSRRGRRIRSVVILALLISGFNLFAQISSGAQATDTSLSASSVSKNVEYVSVRSGDTLWTMAGDLAPNSDPREWIKQVVWLNSLSSIDLVAGQRLAIPQR